MLITCTSDVVLSEIVSNGVTWTLDGEYQTGQFITGDWWYVGPGTVASVSPGWDGAKNGSMVNPINNLTVQGYDTRLSGAGYAYDGTKRATFPLAMVPGESLISVIGKTTPTSGGGATKISAAAVLTCLASPPPANAFRPPYVGATKTIWTTDDVDYDLLPGLAVPSGATLIDMSASGDYLNKVWLSHGNRMVDHAEIHPEDHMGGASASARGYPFEMAKRISRMALACLCDIPEAQSIANRLIQYGIDMQANLSGNSMTFARMGGFGHGRKWPILFAKTMLGAAWTIPYYVTGSDGMPKFQEDNFTYIGTGDIPRWGEICDISGYPGTYAGDNHNCRAPDGDYDQWEMYLLPGKPYGDASLYELANTSKVWSGIALAARLMEAGAGTMTAWGNPAFFAYVDRFVAAAGSGDFPRSTGGIAENADAYTPDIAGTSLINNFQIDANKFGGTGASFMKRMWETYRAP